MIISIKVLLSFLSLLTESLYKIFITLPYSFNCSGLIVFFSSTAERRQGKHLSCFLTWPRGYPNNQYNQSINQSSLSERNSSTLLFSVVFDYVPIARSAHGISSMPTSSTSPHSPSVLSERRNWRRLSGLSATSTADQPANGHSTAITEEISEIKRYEDFTTIDWVQDAVHEQARRRAKRRDGSGFWDQEGTLGWRRKVRESYDAGQAWLVITIVGAVIGFISAFLNIITEWLSDIKLGHCTTAFYLNESFCCWGSEGGTL
jgi:hypothetical protein